jgi:hypothetical protein
MKMFLFLLKTLVYSWLIALRDLGGREAVARSATDPRERPLCRPSLGSLLAPAQER